MKTVLIAEDDRTTRLLLRGVLKSAGFSVATAANGALALKQLREKDFDLLLTDIWMPRLNGLELLASLREQARRPRVLVMTSDNTPETLLRAVREQAYHYITKPIDPKALVDLVKDSLAAKPTSPPIEVLSARPNWVELLVPCDLEVANRITGFMDQLRADLPDDIRERIGMAFRELLTNAVEWGETGSQPEGTHLLLARPPDGLVSDRRPRDGFSLRRPETRRLGECPRPPLGAYRDPGADGCASRGLWSVDGQGHRR